MNAARSDSVPSALLLTKSLDRCCSNQPASDVATARMKPSLSLRSVSRSVPSAAARPCVEDAIAIGGLSEAVEMRRHADPAAVPLRVDVGVAAAARLAIGFAVAEPGVDQCELAHEAHAHVDRLEAAAGRAGRDALDERAAIEDRAVDGRYDEVVGQVLLVPSDVALLG